jgi:hypothetical protein
VAQHKVRGWSAGAIRLFQAHTTYKHRLRTLTTHAHAGPHIVPGLSCHIKALNTLNLLLNGPLVSANHDTLSTGADLKVLLGVPGTLAGTMGTVLERGSSGLPAAALFTARCPTDDHFTSGHCLSECPTAHCAPCRRSWTGWPATASLCWACLPPAWPRPPKWPHPSWPAASCRSWAGSRTLPQPASCCSAWWSFS